jgi:hypothetical protein
VRNFTFRYIGDFFSLNNSRFGDFVDRIYPIELEIKDTTDTDRSASYLDIHLELDSEGRLKTKLNKNNSKKFEHIYQFFFLKNVVTIICSNQIIILLLPFNVIIPM